MNQCQAKSYDDVRDWQTVPNVHQCEHEGRYVDKLEPYRKSPFYAYLCGRHSIQVRSGTTIEVTRDEGNTYDYVGIRENVPSLVGY